MKFWTLMGTDDGEKESYSRRRSNDFPIPQSGTLAAMLGRTKKVIPTEDFLNQTTALIIMALPTEEDFAALGNALVARYNSNGLYVAISPLTLASTVKYREENLKDSYSSYSLKQWHDSNDQTIKIYRDGEVGNICTGCQKIMHRASGACQRFYFGCTGTMFGDDLTNMPRIKMPDINLYIPLQECCKRYPFESYKLRNIEPQKISPTQRIVTKQQSDSALIAAATRYASKSFCPKCIFNYKEGARCSGGLHSRRCGGPYFLSDLPEPEDRTRRLLRMCGHHIEWEAYEANVKSNWTHKKWRMDPQFYTGFVSLWPLTLGILQTRACGNNYSAACTPGADEKMVIDTFFPEKWAMPLSEKATPLEKMVCFSIANQRVHGLDIPWGGWSRLFGVSYFESSDSAVFHYFLRNCTMTIRINDIKDMISKYPRIAYDLTTDRKELLNLIYDRHSATNSLKVLDVAMNTLTQADQAIQAGKITLMPRIADVIKHAKAIAAISK